jgi:hypothetical protein
MIVDRRFRGAYCHSSLITQKTTLNIILAAGELEISQLTYCSCSEMAGHFPFAEKTIADWIVLLSEISRV